MKADIVQTQDVAPKDHCSHKVPSTKHHLEKVLTGSTSE